jgi:hypothetical protein
MRRQTYLVRKGARYHFRRRPPAAFACSRHITLSLNTAEPDQAGRLARRLAAKWDEMVMTMALERGTLTRVEQRRLFVRGLEEELEHATRGVGMFGAADGHARTHKILAAAYALVGQMSPDDEAIYADQVDAVVDADWSEADRNLLVKTLQILITPRTINAGAAARALKEIDAPINDATVSEARAALLRGRIEAHRRAELVTHPILTATGDPAFHLLNDALVAEARRTQMVVQTTPASPPPASAPAPVSVTPTTHNPLYASETTIRFSEQIDDLEKALFELNGWQPDNGKTRLMLESFAWITGDKPMSSYRPGDIPTYVQRLANIPKDFKWGELGKSGGMAEPFDPAKFSKRPPADKRRSDRTINSYLTKLSAASDLLKKSHWLPAIGFGKIMNFTDDRKKIEDDPANPSRVPWTAEHLRVMYSLPLWQGGGGTIRRLRTAATPFIYQDAAYWVPLIGTYLGLAREEACGLELADFNFECAVPYLLVQANMTRSKDGETKAGLKRLSRYRVMPIHPELLRLGFREYVEAIGAEGYQMIFPELYVPEAKAGKKDAKSPATGGKRFYAISWVFTMDGTHAIMPLPETPDGKKADFHSQRTYNNSVLASPEVSETLLADHMGHARRGTGPRSYNRRALTIGQEQHLRERLEVMVKQMPVVTDHVPRAASVNLLHISNRSRVGSAEGRNAKQRFCA